jgi:hypothetical protein
MREVTETSDSNHVKFPNRLAQRQAEFVRLMAHMGE